jgi:hypothetical protein
MSFTENKEKTHGKTPITLLEMEFGNTSVTIDNCDSVLTSNTYGTGKGYYVLSVDNADYKEGMGSNHFDFKAPDGIHRENAREKQMDGTAWCGYFTTNGTLISFTTSPVDLSGRDKILFYGKSTGAGQFLRLRFGENSYSENGSDIVFESPNTWEVIEIDISGIADSNKNSISKWAFEVVNSPSGLNNDVWIDGMEGKNLLRLSDKPVKFGSIKYEPRILSIDEVEHAVENWEGELQAANSNVRILDTDNYFRNLRKSKIIKNRSGKILIGFKGDDYSEFETVFKGKIRDETLSSGIYSFSLEDSLSKYDKIIPKRVYSKLLYPNMEDNFQGKVIPYGIGRISGVTPCCIDSTIGTYKLCDHEIKSISSVKYDDDDVDYVSDLSNGEFSLSLQSTFTIGFEGTPAILTKADTRLYTYVPATWDVLDIDLTHASYDTISELCSYINGKDGYSASLIGNGGMKSKYLKNVLSESFAASYTFNIQVPEDSTDVMKVDFVGLPDDGSGTYTGTASATIENPVDVIYCIANHEKFGGMPSSEIDTTQLSILRGDFGGFRVGRYIDEKVSIFNILSHLGRDSFIWIYAGTDGKLTVMTAETDKWGTDIHDCDTLLDDGTVDHGGDGYVQNTVDTIEKEEGSGSNRLYFKSPATRHQLNSTKLMDDTGYIGWFSVTGSKIRWTTTSIDLRYKGNYIYYYARADTPGTYMKLSMGADSWEEYSTNIQIDSADTWELKEWDISGIPDSVLGNLRYWQLELINADSGITMNFWIDFIRVSEFEDYYWEDGKYARIEDETLSIDSTIEDIWNKFTVVSGYDYSKSVFTSVASLEDITSQDDTAGYGISEDYLVNAYWLPSNFDVVNIKYIGGGATAELSITGEGSDSTNIFSTSCANVGDNISIDLTTQLYDTVGELVNHVNGLNAYSMETILPSYASLDSLGLRAVSGVDITATLTLEYGEGKLLAERLKEKHSTSYDRYKFTTSLYGFGEELGIVVGVKNINDNENTRVRLKKARKRPTDNRLIWEGVEEPIRIS